jgi:hypothetical protein
MPKPLKEIAANKAKPPARPKRPTDPNRAAHAMLAEHMARAGDDDKPQTFQAQYRAHMAKLGAKGGRVSGKRRKTNLSEEQRREIASKAARKRWADGAAKKASKKRG